LRPKEDIIPPIYERDEIASFEASYTDDVTFEHPYRAVAPNLDLKLFESGLATESYPRKMGITEQIHLGAKNATKGKTGPAQRALNVRHVHGTNKVPLTFWNLYLVPSQDSFQYWHNPFAIGAVADAIRRNYNSFIPRYMSPKKKELIEMRDRWYGRPLSWNEWMEIGNLHPADILLLWTFRESWNQEQLYYQNWNLTAITKLMRKFPGFGVFADCNKNLQPDNVLNAFEKWVDVGLIRELREKERKDRKAEAAALRKAEAIFEMFDHPVNPAIEQSELDEIYASRSDPEGIYEIPGEEIIEAGIESQLGDIFLEDEENLPVEGESFTVDELMDDIFG
jgi:hypothetical protein